MTLDACVACDCFEKGRLNVPERFAGRLSVDSEGFVELVDGDPEEEREFDNWLSSACPHDRGILRHEFLGNIARVGHLRSVLAQLPSPPEFVLERIVYDATHEGWVELDELDILSCEVRQISEACDDPDVAYFCHQMKGLIEASQSVGKPILF